MIFTFSPKSKDDDSEHELVAKLDNHMQNLNLDFSIDNNGIGGYEFWGMKGFDCGVNFIESISHDQVKVEIKNLSKNDAIKFLNLIISDIKQFNEDFDQHFHVELYNSVYSNNIFKTELIWVVNDD